MPAPRVVATRYAEEGLVVLLVNQGETETTMRDFLAEMGLTWPVFKGSDLNATRLYRVQALPTTFFIDREGRIQDLTIGGPMTDAYLSSRVPLLVKGVGGGPPIATPTLAVASAGASFTPSPRERMNHAATRS